MRTLSMLIISIFSFAGCAGVKFYKQGPDDTDETTPSEIEAGIPFYTPKPYLMVVQTGAKDKPIESSIVYLPDLSKPLYARPMTGIGSAKMQMGFSNGILTTFGQETDPKITELIASVSGVPGLLATAAKTRAETAELREQSSTLPQIAILVESISQDLDGLKNVAGYANVLSASQDLLVKAVTSKLSNIGKLMNAPGAELNRGAFIDQLEGSSEQLKGLNAPSADGMSDEAKNIWKLIGDVKERLSKIIVELKPKQSSPPTVTLYEIEIDGSGTKLKPVPIP